MVIERRIKELWLSTGTKRVPYLEENLKSLDVKLSQAELDQLRDIISPDKVIIADQLMDFQASLKVSKN